MQPVEMKESTKSDTETTYVSFDETLPIIKEHSTLKECNKEVVNITQDRSLDMHRVKLIRSKPSRKKEYLCYAKRSLAGFFVSWAFTTIVFVIGHIYHRLLYLLEVILMGAMFTVLFLITGIVMICLAYCVKGRRTHYEVPNQDHL